MYRKSYRWFEISIIFGLIKSKYLIIKNENILAIRLLLARSYGLKTININFISILKSIMIYVINIIFVMSVVITKNVIINIKSCQRMTKYHQNIFHLIKTFK